jgi:hypothetical protein
MKDFSASAAIGAGFRLLGHNPLVLLAWAGVYLVLGVLPSSIVWLQVWPAMVSEMANRTASAPSDMVSAITPIGAWAPLIWLASLVLLSVMYGAVYRAVLEPDNKGFFYLRLGGQELWLGLTMIALLILFGIACAIMMIALALIGHSAPGIVTFVAILAAFVGMIWLAMRFSLATPMAFAQRRFIFLESWSLTAGHALKMFGVALALVVIIALGEMLLVIPIAITAGIFGVHAGALRSLGDDPNQMLQHAAPWIVVGGLVLSLIVAASYAILGAPWADIYRQLTAEPAA